MPQERWVTFAESHRIRGRLHRRPGYFTVRRYGHLTFLTGRLFRGAKAKGKPLGHPAGLDIKLARPENVLEQALLAGQTVSLPAIGKSRVKEAVAKTDWESVFIGILPSDCSHNPALRRNRNGRTHWMRPLQFRRKAGA